MSNSDNLLSLTPPVFYILLSLSGGEKHGYAIMQEVAAVTEGHIKLGPGTLYGSIKKMIVVGLITESDERPISELDDERRRYYRITSLGRQAVTLEAERLARTVSVARQRGLIGDNL